MTDHDPHPDDELVTAVLDGEATPEEVARVERDPVLAARRAELAAVAGRVAEPVAPLAPSVVDDLLATALAAAGTTDPAGTDAGPDDVATARHAGTVADLDARRPSGSRPVGRWLAVAAVVLVVLAVPLALSLRSEPSEQFAQVGSAIGGESPTAAGSADGAADESVASELDAASRSGAGAAPDAAVPSTTVAPSPGAPGYVEDEAAIAYGGPTLWLGDLGLLTDGGDGPAAAAAAVLRSPSAPPPTPVTPDPASSSVWSAALDCTGLVEPGGTLAGLAFAGIDEPGDVRVLVVVSSQGTSSVVVVDGVSPAAAGDAPCGAVIDRAPLQP